MRYLVLNGFLLIIFLSVFQYSRAETLIYNKSSYVTLSSELVQTNKEVHKLHWQSEINSISFAQKQNETIISLQEQWTRGTRHLPTWKHASLWNTLSEPSAWFFLLHEAWILYGQNEWVFQKNWVYFFVQIFPFNLNGYYNASGTRMKLLHHIR